MTAGNPVHLTIEQGATFRQVIRVNRGGTPMSLEGYAARAQGRISIDAAETVFDLTSENGGISIQAGDDGIMALFISDDDTADMPACDGVWDMELEYPDGDVIRLMRGTFTVDPEVTRPEVTP